VTTKCVPRSKVPRSKAMMMMKTILMRKASAATKMLPRMRVVQGHAQMQERRL
jgi:hypothetical protein